MSYIDTIRHSIVGEFAGLPVYHPLETLAGSNYLSDFPASPVNLVVGGGSGEHPGMVIQSLDQCFWIYLEFMVEDIYGMDASSIPFFDKLYECDSIGYDIYNNLKFYGWYMDEIKEFSEKVNTLFARRLGIIRVHRRLTCEEKISIMIGEFIFHKATRLLSKDLIEYIEGNIDMLKSIVPDIWCIFDAISVAPHWDALNNFPQINIPRMRFEDELTLL